MGQQLDVMRFKLNQPALIEASAGTGKTYTITNLVLRILLGSGDQVNALERPLLIDDLLIVTFTNVATADLRRRIYERIRMAHVLFDNFLEIARQELLKKVHELARKEAATSLGKSSRKVNESEVDEFCEAFLQDESLSPKLAQQLEKFKLNIEKIARDKLGCSDTFLIQLLKQVAEKDAVREAISVLTRAERSIDNAAICTIHSFCNRTLNQIYAFEANEVFTTELTADLSDEEQAAANTVWRQQFYKLSASPAVLQLLDIREPGDLKDVRRNINSVRLSQDYEGVFGYQLLNFKIPGFSPKLDLSRDFNVPDLLQRLFYRVEILNIEEGAKLFLTYQHWRSMYESQLKDFIALDASDGLGPYLQGKVKAWTKAGKGIAHGLNLFEMSFQRIAQNPSLVNKLHEAQALIETAQNQAGGESHTDGTHHSDGARQAVAEPLSCELAKSLLGKLQALNIKEELGDVTSWLQDACKSFKDFQCSGEKVTHLTRSSKVSADPIYQDFFAHVCELVDNSRQIVSLKQDLKPILCTLLSMQINLQIRAQCAEHHLMSNDDLLLRLDQALQRDVFGERLAKLIRMRYPLAMIDEFQDTDPIQYSIFSRIYLNPSALEDKAYCYLIGDPKQSIYAFRGSDINSYLKARNQIKRLTDNQGLCTLGVNYRSTEDVIEACNALFSRDLNPENASPFKERDIPFVPVGVSKMRNRTPSVPTENLKVDSLEMAQAWNASFVIENLQQDGLLAQWTPVEPELTNLTATADDAASAQAAAPKPKAKGRAKKSAPAQTEQSAQASAQADQTAPALGQVQAEQNAQAKDATSSQLEVVASNLSAVQTDVKADEAEVQAQAALDDAAGGGQLVMPRALANTYVVSFTQNSFDSVGKLRESYAQSAAFLIKKVLDDGKIIDKNSVRVVKPSDIAILVRSSAENEIMQNALQALGLSSVYFSDASSVLLQDNGTPTQESLDLLYLMEAMCDHANRSKVMRVLGSGLLCLHTQEFLEHIKDQNFEREVKILSECAQVWERYGFMPAFVQWCNAPEHQVIARLLSIINGERILTNYNQISELIQSAHNKRTGMQSQLRWFYDTLFSGNNDFDAEATQKRLESEHEQIKILTIHKSKGLEFPIVFMPFLWCNVIPRKEQKNLMETAKYYSYDVKHMVLDYDTHKKLRIPDIAKMALDALHAKAQGEAAPYAEEILESDEALDLAWINSEGDAAEQGQAEDKDGTQAEVKAEAAEGKTEADKGKAQAAGKRQIPYMCLSPKELETYEMRKELTRLLYVAITRARVANFFFIGEYHNTRSQGFASALMMLFDVDKTDGQLYKVLNPLAAHPELFTLLQGDNCLQKYHEELAHRHREAPQLAMAKDVSANVKRAADIKAELDRLLAEAIELGQEMLERKKPGFTFVGQVPLERKRAMRINELRQELQLLQVNNVPVKAPDDPIKTEPCAMSFVYQGAFDTSFNIMSYSKLTSGKDPVKKALLGQAAAKRDEDEDGSVDVEGVGSDDPMWMSPEKRQNLQEPSGWLGVLSPTGLGTLVGGNLYRQAPRAISCKYSMLRDTNVPVEAFTLNDFVQACWDSHKVINQSVWTERPSGLNFDFPRGAEPGTFLHEVLRMIDFSEIQTSQERKRTVLGDNLINLIESRNDLQTVYKQSKVNESPNRLTDWLMDIVEAPIIQGHKQCLALADLQPQSFIHEMNFLMTSRRFNTQEVDEICQDMARQILPESMQAEIIPNLVLKPDEIFGFITGSLDLACRFDLNYQGDLKYRQDLLEFADTTHAAHYKRMMPEYHKNFKLAPRAGKAQVMATPYDDPALEQQITEAQFEAEQYATDEPDEKYYVIDYKSNILGERFEDYSTKNMLLAIYQHRYDVQFLFYTLALYRFLKRRKGVEPTADYATLQEFYNQNVGGVIYMYLRGLKADFNRRRVSTGVFSAKIDFEFVERLDQVFGAEQQWEV